jgi:transcriptional regulator of aroF, aroG, tyrA and aromatic amino acid transport
MVQPNLYIDASTLGSDVLEEMRDAFLGMSGGLMLMSTFPECR